MSIPTAESDYSLCLGNEFGTFFDEFEDHTSYLFEAEQAVCDHARGDISQGSIDPEPGTEDFYCPVCKFGFHHCYY